MGDEGLATPKRWASRREGGCEESCSRSRALEARLFVTVAGIRADSDGQSRSERAGCHRPSASRRTRPDPDSDLRCRGRPRALAVHRAQQTQKRRHEPHRSRRATNRVRPDFRSRCARGACGPPRSRLYRIAVDDQRYATRQLADGSRHRHRATLCRHCPRRVVRHVSDVADQRRCRSRRHAEGNLDRDPEAIEARDTPHC